MPIITVVTINTEINISIFLLGNPNVLAKSESNETILNSFQKRIIIIKRIIPVIKIISTSLLINVEACPKINLFKPDLFAPGNLFI